MDNQTLTALIGFLGVLVGGIIGGTTVLVLYGRAVKSILDSPVIIRSLELAAASLPPEALSAIRDTGRLLTDIGTTDIAVKTVTTTEAVPITDRAVG